MLRIDDNLTFTRRVKINLVGLQAEFDAHLRLLPADEVEAMQKDVAEGRMSGLDFARRVLAGWPDGAVGNAAGEPMPPDEAGIAALLRMPGVPAAVIRAFWGGYDEATEGNSAPPPAGC